MMMHNINVCLPNIYLYIYPTIYPSIYLCLSIYLYIKTHSYIYICIYIYKYMRIHPFSKTFQFEKKIIKYIKLFFSHQKVSLFNVCLYIYLCGDRKKQRDYTFIPTSRFRDCSRIRGFIQYVSRSTSAYRALYNGKIKTQASYIYTCIYFLVF